MAASKFGNEPALTGYWQTFYDTSSDLLEGVQIPAIDSGEPSPSITQGTITVSEACSETTRLISESRLSNDAIIAILQALLTVPVGFTFEPRHEAFLATAGHVLLKISAECSNFISDDVIQQVLLETGKSGLRKILRAVQPDEDGSLPGLTVLGTNEQRYPINLFEHVGLVANDTLVSKLLYAKRYFTAPRFYKGSIRNVLGHWARRYCSHRYGHYLALGDTRPQLAPHPNMTIEQVEHHLNYYTDMFQAKQRTISGHTETLQQQMIELITQLTNALLIVAKFQHSLKDHKAAAAVFFENVWPRALEIIPANSQEEQDFWMLLVQDSHCYELLDEAAKAAPESNPSVLACTANLTNAVNHLEHSEQYITSAGLRGIISAAWASLFPDENAGDSSSYASSNAGNDGNPHSPHPNGNGRHV